MKLKIGSKGQMSINNMFNIFALIIVGAAILPIIVTVIQMAINSVDPTTALLLGLIPTAIIVGIIKTILAYSQPYVAYFKGEQ